MEGEAIGQSLPGLRPGCWQDQPGCRLELTGTYPYAASVDWDLPSGIFGSMAIDPRNYLQTFLQEFLQKTWGLGDFLENLGDFLENLGGFLENFLKIRSPDFHSFPMTCMTRVRKCRALALLCVALGRLCNKICPYTRAFSQRPPPPKK